MNPTPPLLALVEGRTSRARKAPTGLPKETTLHMAVAALLRDHARSEWRWTHFPAGEARDVRMGARLKAMGLQRGWPDFILVPPSGLLHALELKRLGEQLTEEQEQLQRWFIVNGLPHSVAYSVDEAFAVLDCWDALRIKIARQGARHG
jgi:hypothetical protein